MDTDAGHKYAEKWIQALSQYTQNPDTCIDLKYSVTYIKKYGYRQLSLNTVYWNIDTGTWIWALSLNR